MSASGLPVRVHHMPSPIGHALGGIAAGWLAGGRLPTGQRATVFRSFVSTDSPVPVTLATPQLEALFFGTVAVAPDLDLLVGAHSAYTHSVGAVVLIVCLTLVVTRGRRPRVALGVAAAWASHILLDWLGSDTSPPIGIMALWPFTDGFHQSSLFVFDAISRRYWLPQEFVWGNLRAVVREVVVLGPVAWVAWRLRLAGV
jgi:membrane-bound metal-dependent hydrolase YbcI (DUF457 family)